MKHLKYIILLVCFVFASSVFSQKIIKVKKPYVLIDISRESGYRVGDELLVYHPGEEDEDKLVGVVELVVFKADECAAKIIKESVSTKIQVGDVVAPYRTSAQNKDKPRVSSRPSTPSRYGLQKKSQMPSYVTLTAGIISCSVGYYYYNEAEKNSRVVPAGLEEYENLKDETKKFDNTANFCFGLGGGLVVYGIVNYILTYRTNIRINQRVSVMPVHKRDFFGMGLTVNLNK